MRKSFAPHTHSSLIKRLFGSHLAHPSLGVRSHPNPHETLLPPHPPHTQRRSPHNAQQQSQQQHTRHPPLLFPPVPPSLSSRCLSRRSGATSGDTQGASTPMTSRETALLATATSHGSDATRKIDWLIHKGANPNKPNKRGSVRLRLAWNGSNVKALLQGGADPNRKDGEVATPAMSHAFGGDTWGTLTALLEDKRTRKGISL